MIEYFALIIVVVVFGNGLSMIGVNPAWIVIPTIILTLPSVYTTFSGSPFLPTDQSTVRKMIALAEIKPGELVYDLGCGDGRLLKEASSLGAIAVGYELSVYMYCIARWRGFGEVRYANFWNADLSDADVIFCFVGKLAMARFQTEIWPALKPGCRVIVHAFEMPDLQPTQNDRHVFRYDVKLENSNV